VVENANNGNELKTLEGVSIEIPKNNNKNKKCN
jgi:hypothetical protein